MTSSGFQTVDAIKPNKLLSNLLDLFLEFLAAFRLPMSGAPDIRMAMDYGFVEKHRADQLTLLRMRTGHHNRLNAHLFNKMKMGQSEMCPCPATPLQ